MSFLCSEDGHNSKSNRTEISELAFVTGQVTRRWYE